MGTSLYEQFQRETAKPSSLYSQFLAEQGRPDGAEKLHAEYASGRLGTRIAGQNAREAATVADEEASQPGALEQIAAHGANIAQGVPGMEAIEAGIGSGVSHLTSHRMGYRESLNALRDATGRIPVAQRVAEQIVGGAPAAGLIGESTALARVAQPLASAVKAVPIVGRLAGRVPVALAGATYGALRGATDANPDANRLTETAIGAGAGGALGSILPAKTTAAPGMLARAATNVAADADAGVGVLGRMGSEVEPNVTQQTVAAARSTGTPARDAARQRVVAAIRNRATPSVEPNVTQQTAAPTPAAPVPAPKPSLEETMRALSRKVGGNLDAPPEWSDAELAMGHDAPQPNLEDLLRRSIIRLGGKPVVPPSP